MITPVPANHKIWFIDIATIVRSRESATWPCEDAISLHGIPETIYTDRAAIFGTEEPVAHLAKLGISRIEGGKKKSTRTVERFFGRLRNSHLFPFLKGQHERA